RGLQHETVHTSTLVISYLSTILTGSAGASGDCRAARPSRFDPPGGRALPSRLTPHSSEAAMGRIRFLLFIAIAAIAGAVAGRVAAEVRRQQEAGEPIELSLEDVKIRVQDLVPGL